MQVVRPLSHRDYLPWIQASNLNYHAAITTTPRSVLIFYICFFCNPSPPPGSRSGLLGNTNHPGLRTGGGTGGELQWHVRWREEQPWDAAARSHVRGWHLPSLHRGPDLQTQPPPARYSCADFSWIQTTVVSKQTWRLSVWSKPLCKWLCWLVEPFLFQVASDLWYE